MADYEVTVDYTDLKMFNEYLNKTSANISTKIRQSANSFDEFKKSKMDVDRLRGSIDPLYAATQRYEQQVEILSNAVRRKTLTEIEAKRIQDQLNISYGVAEGKVTKLGVAHTLMGKKMSRSSMVAQQFGYQIGDFLVQVQSGQSALVAFAQQGTQLAGLLPGFAGLIVGVGLAASTMAAGFFRSTESTKKTDNALSDLLSTMGDIQNSAKLLIKNVSDLDKEYGKFADTITRITKMGLEARLILVQQEVIDSAKEMSKEFKEVNDLLEQRNKLGLAFVEMQTQESLGNATPMDVLTAKESFESVIYLANQAAESFNLTATEVGRFQEALDKVSTANGMEQVAQSAAAALDTITSMYSTTNQMPSSVAAIVVKLEELAKGAIDTSEALDDSSKKVLIIARTDMASGINAAAIEADALAGRLRASVSFVLQLKALASQVPPPVDSNLRFGLDPAGTPGTGNTAIGFGDLSYLDDSYRNITDLRVEEGKKKKKGSGGASKANLSFIENMRTEMAHRRTLLGLYGEERDLAEEIYRINQGLGEAKNKYSALAISNLAQENLALQAQEELYQKSMQNMQAFYDNVENSFSEAFTSIIDGTESVEDAFKKMAKSIIDQLLQVIIQQKIVGSFSASTGKGSGIMGAIFGGGGFLGSIFGRESGGPVSANQPYIVGEKEPELFVPRTSGTIYNQQQLSQMNSGGSGGGTMELIVRSEDGVTIDVVRNETNMQIRKAAPGIVNASVNASQKSLRNGPKSSWGL